MSAGERLLELYPDMIGWRRHLHRNPELSYQEERTAAFIAQKLEQFGIKVTRNVGGYGVVGDLDGPKAGPRVALRADMDALPIQDEKSCAYASEVPGVMHACGHDGHVAALLGAAQWLAEKRDLLAGSVRFIFQPAEELSPGGAAPMIRDGVLDGVDVIYGAHLWTPFPVGEVYTRSGPIMAAADEFMLEIIGRGGHGGLPHETVDSLVVASHLVINLQSIVSRNLNPVEPSVISVGSFHGGTGFNVIAERSLLNGTVRTFKQELRDQAQARIEKVTEDTCSMFEATYRLDYKLGYPPVINHARETEQVFETGKRIFGEDKVKEAPLIMAGEDFSFYLERVPGCFFFVGAGNAGKGITAPHHHPRFDIDEQAILQASRLLAELAADKLIGTN
ncbi:MAG: amidohydrolase [Paenibacillaceae bacterium]|jgi:amidohydrolase|nr:amidohydrolase [Paenibacillaceae bacterium]